MTGFNSKIDSQDCYIEINQDDLVINNKSSQISCKALEIDENINLDIEVSDSEITPRITFKVLRDEFVNLDIKIVLLKQAKLEILDESVYFKGSNIVIYSELKENSSFELYRLNKFNQSTENSYFHKCDLSKDCIFKDFNFTNGSKLMNNETIVSLADEHAKYIGSGVVITNSTNCNNSLKVNHIAPSAVSDCSFKTVSRGNANVTFNGKILVEKNCSNSVSNQISKGLIMNEEARVNLIPKLEINNDDVICSHGAASGKPDENVLFYLTSRGISREEAEKIYIQGFLGEFIDKIDNAQMKAKAKQFISQNS
jgi:Fe-S cluster assembly scaffold protein SufB